MRSSAVSTPAVGGLAPLVALGAFVLGVLAVAYALFQDDAPSLPHASMSKASATSTVLAQAPAGAVRAPVSSAGRTSPPALLPLPPLALPAKPEALSSRAVEGSVDVPAKVYKPRAPASSPVRKKARTSPAKSETPPPATPAASGTERVAMQGAVPPAQPPVNDEPAVFKVTGSGAALNPVASSSTIVVGDRQLQAVLPGPRPATASPQSAPSPAVRLVETSGSRAWVSLDERQTVMVKEGDLLAGFGRVQRVEPALVRTEKASITRTGASLNPNPQP